MVRTLLQKAITRLVYPFIFIVIFIFFSCQSIEPQSGEEAYQSYCGSCHLPTDVRRIPKRHWKETILPQMGALLGRKDSSYNPFKGMSMQEAFYIKSTGAYPEEPKISLSNWKQIQDYILSLAPDTIYIDRSRSSRSSPLSLFSPHTHRLDRGQGAQITSLTMDHKLGRLIIGTGKGELYEWKPSRLSQIPNYFSSPISSVVILPNQYLIAEIGIIFPSDQALGKVWKIENGYPSLWIEGLKRPVHLLAYHSQKVHNDNLSNDSVFEQILISEYGNLGGSLSAISSYTIPANKKKKIITAPGFIKVVSADTNGDQLMDLVGLAAQGNEGMYVCEAQGDGTFRARQILRFPPESGSSWFELVDYEGDGDLDIALVQGDNADLSYFMKPYHGLKIFINDGNFQFEEQFFFPLYGATRVIARDFDQDGDVDFALTAFFPDYTFNAKESFVYLKNTDEDAFQFQAQTFPEAVQGRWLVMEAGDVDQDGDEDIMLGSFTYSPSPTPMSVRQSWYEGDTDFIWLENQLQ